MIVPAPPPGTASLDTAANSGESLSLADQVAPPSFTPASVLPAGSAPGAATAAPTPSGTPSPAPTVASPTGSGLASFLGIPSTTDLVGGILGLMLIAAGIFTFKPVRETIVTAAKTAATAAA